MMIINRINKGITKNFKGITLNFNDYIFKKYNNEYTKIFVIYKIYIRSY